MTRLHNNELIQYFTNIIIFADSTEYSQKYINHLIAMIKQQYIIISNNWELYI